MPDMTFNDAALISHKAFELCKRSVCTKCPFDLESHDCRLTSDDFLTPAQITDLFISLTEVKDLIDKFEEDKND